MLSDTLGCQNFEKNLQNLLGIGFSAKIELNITFQILFKTGKILFKMGKWEVQTCNDSWEWSCQFLNRIVSKASMQ